MSRAFLDEVKSQVEGFHTLVDQELNRFFSVSGARRQSAIAQTRVIAPFLPEALAAPCAYAFAKKGKMLRPILGSLMLHAFGARESSDIKRCLVWPEILHGATLMVDDIEDGATLRRGRPCVHVPFGVDVAVNLGNALYFLPFFALGTTRLSDKLQLQVHRILTEAMNRIHLGQGLDIHWHNREVSLTPAQYEVMARLKTSTFFRTEAQLACLFARVGGPARRAALDFAESLGVAFQILDDVLDLTVSEEEKGKFGKAVGQDIAEGKKTLIVALALKRATPRDRRELQRLLGLRSRKPSVAQGAIQIFEKYDCITDAGLYAEGLVLKSWNRFAPTLKPSRAMDLLHAYSEFVVQRRF